MARNENMKIKKRNMSKSQEKKDKRRKFPNVFFKEHMVKVFDAIEDPKTMMGAFIAFVCALRISEVCELKWKDVDLENGELKVVNGKNYKDGFIPISPVAIPILLRWKEMNLNEEYFLPTDKTKVDKVQDFYWRNSLMKAFKKALIKAELYIPTEKNSIGYQQHQYKFHTLRHSRCTHLINNKVPLELVQHFMRHDRIDTTLVYTWITNPELKSMVAQADQPNKDYEMPNAEKMITKPTTPATPTIYFNPVEIAKRRLVKGEIGTREFNRLINTLNLAATV